MFGVFLVLAMVAAGVRGGDWLGSWALRNAASRPPVVDDRALLEARYERWKQAHALPVEDLMDLYSPTARLNAGGRIMTMNDLRLVAGQVRQDRSFDQVSDVETPQILIKGNHATITARHTYNHSNPQFSPYLGDRILIWKKRDGQWLIFEDSYTLEPLQGSQVLPQGLPPLIQ